MPSQPILILSSSDIQLLYWKQPRPVPLKGNETGLHLCPGLCGRDQVYGRALKPPVGCHNRWPRYLPAATLPKGCRPVTSRTLHLKGKRSVDLSKSSLNSVKEYTDIFSCLEVYQINDDLIAADRYSDGQEIPLFFQ